MGSAVPEDKPTVCISFEPRDEAAAQRVASALRDAGIDVRLASEEGAAAVDACDLFLPIVSDNTQTQSAGRFRNEWQRAAQRAEAMADNAGFLLPVVVDNTPNREAKVPAAFHGRPWLRFDVWGATAPLVSRVAAMLERRSAAQAREAAEQQAAAEQLARSMFRRWLKRLPPWVRRLRLVWIVTLVVLPGGALVWRAREAGAATAESAEPTVRSAAAGGAAVVSKDDGAPKPDGDRPPAVSQGPGARNAAPTGGDRTAATTRDAAVENSASFSDFERSTPLAGDGTRSGHWLPQPELPRVSAGPVNVFHRTADEAEVWADVQMNSGETVDRFDESWRPPIEEAADKGPEVVDNAEVIRPGSDPANTPAAVDAVVFALWRGEPAEAAESVAELGVAWCEGPMFTGPVGVLEGLCWQARQAELGEVARQRARLAWAWALEEVLKRRGQTPADVSLALVEAQVQALLGDEVAALAAVREYDDSVEGRRAGPQREHLIVWALLGDYSRLMDELVARFREGKDRWAEVRDWLRYDLRFTAWREAMARRAREGGAG